MKSPMSRILITGSADGLGRMAARLLISQGHEVVLHARNQARVADAWAAAPGVAGVLAGDLSSIDQMRSVAFALARRWPQVLSNALEPGWVPTKMGAPPHPAVTDTDVQEGLLAACAELTGTALPVSGGSAPPADRTKVP